MAFKAVTSLLFLSCISFGFTVSIPKQWIATVQSLCELAESRSFDVITFDVHVPTGELAMVHDPECFLLPLIVVWSPVEQFVTLDFICPVCNSGGLKASGWTDGSCTHSPRLIYGVQYNALLISRIYNCPSGHVILGHNALIINTLHQNSLGCLIPFRLWHIYGFMQESLEYTEQQVLNGVNLQQLEINFSSNRVRHYYIRKEKFQQLTSDPSISFPEVEEATVKWWMNSPTRHSLTACFLLLFSLKEQAYTKVMRSLSTATNEGWLSCDHTFKAVSNIGLVRGSDKRWIKQYSGLFLVLNEVGQVMTWKMTTSLTFDHIEDCLINVRQRVSEKGIRIKHFYIDNCCAWRRKLQHIFGSELIVYLDLFHAVQRISKFIPKRHPFRKQCMSSLTLVFRDPTDHGVQRRKATPCPQILRTNLESFKNKWQAVTHNGRMILPPKAVNEITCLLKHVDKGCLSGIEVGCGTSKNERLHRDLNKVFQGSRYGVQLGHALLTSIFYFHNEKVAAQQEKRRIRPITSCGTRDPSETLGKLEEEFGLLNTAVEEEIVPKSDRTMISNCKYLFIQEHISEIVMQHGLQDENEDQEDCSQLEFSEVINILKHAVTSYYISGDLLRSSSTSFFQGTDVFFATLLALVHRLPMGEATTNTAVRTLSNVLQSWNFQRVTVPGDGNCLFYAISLSVIQRMTADSSNYLQNLLLSMGLPEDKLNDMHSIATLLRTKVVQEWQDNLDRYQGFTTLDLNIEASNYLVDGEFSGDVGDLMVLAVSNILGIPITIFTSIENMPVLCVIPTSECNTPYPLYLTYIQSGAGHYDYALPSTPSPHSTQVISSQHKCTCGRKQTQSSSGACTTSRCPCIRNKQPCTSSCRCKSCSNHIGIRPSPSTSRRRYRHEAQRQPLCGQPTVDFMKQKNERIIHGEITIMELLILKSIVIYFVCNGISVEIDSVFSAYNQVLDIANLSQLVDFTISSIAIKKVQQFLKKIEIFLELFKQMI